MALGLVVAQFTLPRRFGVAPLLIAICHFQNVPVIEVGGAFSAAKLVIVAEFARTDPCEKQTDPTARQADCTWSRSGGEGLVFLEGIDLEDWLRVINYLPIVGAE